MSEYGTVVEAGTVRIERTLPGPVEKVWDYLTDSKKRGEWLAPGLMELRVGGRVELEFHHADLTPHEETVPEKYKHMKKGRMLAGTVTRCEPPTLLAYTWGEGAEGASEVTFELSARGADVLLVITHRGLDARMMPSVAAGWHTHVGILIDKMHGREPRPFWATHARLAKEYEERLVLQPDLSARPHDLVVERDMRQSPARLYRAWTQEFDKWFATPGSVTMRADAGQPYFFETAFKHEKDGKAERYPHYGRFLRLEPGRLVEMTWMTGKGGTEGAETIVAVEFTPKGAGAHVRLSHKGFPNEAARKQHENAWPHVLAQQEERLGGE